MELKLTSSLKNSRTGSQLLLLLLQLQLVPLTFKVLDGLDAQLQRGVLVTHEDGARVLLEGRHGPHVVDALLDGLVQGKGLVGPCDQDHHLDTQKVSSRLQSDQQQLGHRTGTRYRTTHTLAASFRHCGSIE